MLLAAAIALLLPPLVYISFIVVAVSPGLGDYLNQRDFDSVQWKKWEESESEPRLRWDMVKDLTERYSLVGNKKEEIIELLGEPEAGNTRMLSYYLGATRTGINTGSLRLYLNENQKVVRVELDEGN